MKKSFFNNFLGWGLFACSILILGILSSSIYIQNKKVRRSIRRSSTFFQKSYSSKSPLAKVPFAEESNMILGVKKICIKDIPYPYNGSLEETLDGKYLVVFRFDSLKPTALLSEVKYGPKGKGAPPFYTYLGVAELDPFFNQVNETHILNTQSHFSEDPRLIRINQDYFIVYNDLVPIKTNYRSIRVGKLNLEHFSLAYSTDLDLYINPIEKNWTPFIVNHLGKPELAIAYQFNPHKVMFLKDPSVKNLEHLNYEIPPLIDHLAWSDEWGTIRGGTAARLVDGEYLAFFHSSFVDSETNRRWYTIGAYTFEPNPPYRITRISKNPILFHGIYSTPPRHTAPTNAKVIFPGGFVMQKQGDKEVIQLLCGENDCSLKLISIDKKRLYKSLVKIKYSHNR